MKVLLADDHPLYRVGIKSVVAKLRPKPEIFEAVDYPSAFAMMRHAGGVDLALIDLYMPGMSGMDGVMRFRAAFPDTPLVVLSAAEEVEDIRTLLGAGVLGYIPKSSHSAVILGALRLVMNGGVYLPPSLISPQADYSTSFPSVLTQRQIAVLRELAKGLSNREIGEALSLAEGTVKIHLSAAFRTLNVRTRGEALLVVQKMALSEAD